MLIITNTDILKKSGAAYSRCRLYAMASGLTGLKVCLVSLVNHINRSSDLETDPDGFQYIGQPKENEYFARNIHRIFLPIYTILMLKEMYSKRILVCNSCVIWTPTALVTDLLAFLYLKLIVKARVVCEKNELQQAILVNRMRETGTVWNIGYLLYMYVGCILTDEFTRYFDGVIAISTNLHRWSVCRNQNTILIPILVGPAPKVTYENRSASDKDKLKIAYFGYLSNTKDGLFDFLEVLETLVNHKPRFVFEIYGNGRKSDIERLVLFIEKTGMSEIIRYKGVLEQSKSQEMMCDYDLLVLPRPRNKQTQYGFSTKLGEYMLSGSAVLTTDISDNRLYITDGKNGFIVPPCDKKAMQEKLKYIFFHKQELGKIGAAGRATALKEFFYAKYSTYLGGFATK